MKIARTQTDLSWLPRPNRIDLILSPLSPPTALTTSAFALAFEGDRLAMTNLRQRGWDLPGGHVEAGETPEAAARRELAEECSVEVGALHPVGYQRVRLLCAAQAGYRYPHPDSFMVFFAGRIITIRACIADAETRGRGLFLGSDPEAQRWIQENLELYDAALEAVRTERGD